ncbi:hypothetical protein [Pollutibacter soli]|uniref:hypothetical protein n=1 Tax=Pollutibacter soli TaxID=3034157 RepID=UPI003013D5E1
MNTRQLPQVTIEKTSDILNKLYDFKGTFEHLDTSESLDTIFQCALDGELMDVSQNFAFIRELKSLLNSVLPSAEEYRSYLKKVVEFNEQQRQSKIPVSA